MTSFPPGRLGDEMIRSTARMLKALQRLQEIGGVSDKELIETAVAAGADFDDMEAHYQRYLAAYGKPSPPKTLEDWETLVRQMQELEGTP